MCMLDIMRVCES